MDTLMLEFPAWQIYAGIGFCLCIAEIFIPGFIALPIGVGFLAAAPVAYFSHSPLVQLLALAVAETLVFLALKRFRPAIAKPAVYSNAEGMIGKECEVTESVSAKNSGYVKLYGDRWQAKTHSTKTFEVGQRAIITRIDGNKVYIEELNSSGDFS